MSRIVAREMVMKYIYGLDINNNWDEDREKLNSDSVFIRDFLEENEEIDEKDLIYMNNILMGMSHNLEEIDNLIESNSKDWKLSRFSRIDLSILRLSVYEILYIEDIPHQVSITEAVRLAKKFGSKNSSKFINGILGGIVRSLGIDS
ncbi:MAG: transcription antitermination factor NusB [Andreesenia angusta]|nr:transcription antitermination factor NusB [Andreesenia angusta]